MSATAAILSVTSNNMRADLDAFWAQFNQLTKLPTDMTKGMANLRSLDDELKERRGHDEKLAKINASGQANAEIVKWVLWAVATIVLVTATYFLRGP